MKLKSDSYDILKSELDKSELPFSKSSNSMLAFDLMANGDLMSSNQVTKVNLVNLIKILCEQLEWIEESEVKIENETEPIINSSENTDKVQIDVPKVTNKTQEICKFYKSGKCQYGKNGKKPDKSGKICAFSHPTTCKKFENYGYKEEGCRNKKCDKLHLNLCKIFMRHNSCKFDEKCRYYHPKKWKNIKLKEPENQSKQQQNEEKLSYAKILSRNLHPQNVLLGQQHFMGHPVQGQSPFLEQSPHIQQPIQQPTLVDSQTNQKKILDILMSLSQRMTNLEKEKLQI